MFQKVNGRRPSSSSSVKSTPEEPSPAVPTTPAPALQDKKRPEADIPRGPIPSLPRVPPATPLSTPISAPIPGPASSSPNTSNEHATKTKRTLDHKTTKASNGTLVHVTTNDASNGRKSPSPSDSYTNNNRLPNMANGHHHHQPQQQHHHHHHHHHHHVLSNASDSDSSIVNKNLIGVTKHRNNNSNSSSSSSASSTASNNNNKGDDGLETDNANDEEDSGDGITTSISNKNDLTRSDIYVPLSSPGTDYWLARNPVADQVFITDVTVNLKTVTIRECKTEKGFFRERDPKSDIY